MLDCCLSLQWNPSGVTISLERAMRRPILILVLLAVTLNLPVTAQQATPDSVPARVRIHQAGVKAPIVGMLTGLDGDSLYLQSAEGRLAVARADVRKFEVSRGMRSNADRGFKTGLGAGAVAGLLTGVAILMHPDGCFCDTGPETIPVTMAIMGLPAGLLGAGIGALSHSEQWKKSRIDAPAVTVQVQPWHGQLAVGLDMHF
jgi:hypothetical protein